MPIDDPARQQAFGTYNRREQRGRTADVAATIVLLVVHGFLFAATIALLGLLVMGTDPCGAVKCGDGAWLNRAMMLGIWGGGVVLIADFVVAVYRVVRRRSAFFVPIIGCLAQVGLAIGAAAMDSLAGPV